jgi:hypothetical protein
VFGASEVLARLSLDNKRPLKSLPPLPFPKPWSHLGGPLRRGVTQSPGGRGEVGDVRALPNCLS